MTASRLAGTCFDAMKGRPSTSGAIRTLRTSLASWLRVRSPTNGTSAASPGIGSGANLTTGLTFLLLIHSGGTLLQAPQSPSNSPRSIASRCSTLPVSRDLMDRNPEHVLEYRRVDE